jgi:hypothetical protein
MDLMYHGGCKFNAILKSSSCEIDTDFYLKSDMINAYPLPTQSIEETSFRSPFIIAKFEICYE